MPGKLRDGAGDDVQRFVLRRGITPKGGRGPGGMQVIAELRVQKRLGKYSRPRLRCLLERVWDLPGFESGADAPQSKTQAWKGKNLGNWGKLRNNSPARRHRSQDTRHSPLATTRWLPDMDLNHDKQI